MGIYRYTDVATYSMITEYGKLDKRIMEKHLGGQQMGFLEKRFFFLFWCSGSLLSIIRSAAIYDYPFIHLCIHVFHQFKAFWSQCRAASTLVETMTEHIKAIAWPRSLCLTMSYVTYIGCSRSRSLTKCIMTSYLIDILRTKDMDFGQFTSWQSRFFGCV